MTITLKTRPWTARDARELAALRKAGWTVPGLAARFGRTANAIRAALTRLGCARPRPRRPDDLAARVRSCRRLGRAGVAARLGVHPGTLDRWLREAGVPGFRAVPRDTRERQATAARDRHRRGAAALGWPQADTPSEAAILSALASGGWMRPGGVASATGSTHRSSLSGRLARLLRRGLVERRGSKRWCEYRLAAHLRREAS
jgi:DNA-binding transcriptional ArsR family regulator